MSKGWACICRTGGIGDNLIAASPLKPLKRMGYMNEVITSEYAHAVYLNNPYIDKLTVKQDGDIPGGDVGTQWFATRAKEYDKFIHLAHSCEFRHGLFMGQTAFWWPQDYRRKLCAGSYLETAHDIVGVPYDFGPLFFPTEEEHARAEWTKNTQIGDDYIVWVVSGSRLDKVYPYAAMAIGRIIKELKKPVVMVGYGDKQAEQAKQMQEHIIRQNGSDKMLHSINSYPGADPGGDKDWSVRRSLTQVQHASLVITPDTGVAWAVALEKVPKVVMVSHASVENITKHWVNTITLHADQNRVPCWPCHRLHDKVDTCTPNKDGGHAAACMSDITVDDILIAAWKSLGKP